MLLDRLHHVGEYGRAAGACNHKQIRKSEDSQPKIPLGSLRPLFFKRETVTTADVDFEQGAGHGVKSSRHDQGIEVVFLVQCIDALLCNFLNGGLTHIHQRDIGSVVGLVVVGINGESLTADGVGGHQSFGNHRVFDSLPDFLAYELGCCLIGLKAFSEVGIGTQKHDTTALPESFVLDLPFGFIDFQG